MDYAGADETRAAIQALETEFQNMGVDVPAGAGLEAFHKTCGQGVRWWGGNNRVK